MRFFLPFEDFGVTSPLPASVADYRHYMARNLAFITARNACIAAVARDGRAQYSKQ